MRRSWVAVLLLVGACTGPVRSSGVYESKAGQTAEAVGSAVQTAALAVDALVQDGPLVGGFGAGLRLDGLIVGRRAVGARLGYERRNMKGPLPVKLLVGWLYHDGRFVGWQRIKTIEPDRILISGSVDDLPPPGPSA